MSETRVRVADTGTFTPREWLRREVLWASLMIPYTEQYAGWFNEKELYHHKGNSSRQALYASSGQDSEMQAKAFFNHGKVIGGLVSSVAVFRMRMNGPLDPNNEISEVVLQMQAKSIDKALELPLLQATNGTKGEQEVFEECTHLAKLAVRNPGNQFVNRRYMLRAAKSMSSLACQNVVLWLETSKQDEAESLPLLTIPDGGTPRSAGPRVEMLQPIFHQIIASEAFTRSS